MPWIKRNAEGIARLLSSSGSERRSKRLQRIMSESLRLYYKRDEFFSFILRIWEMKNSSRDVITALGTLWSDELFLAWV
jgi:hypothetical protein